MVSTPETRGARPRWPLQALLAALLLLLLAPRTTRAADAPASPVRTALKQGAFPWYDVATDQVRAVKLPAKPELNENWRFLRFGKSSLADLVVFGVFSLALIGLAVLVALNWKRFEPNRQLTAAGAQPAGPVARSGEVLPAGLRGIDATDDPWAEANRRRLAGDLAGAIICLFAHQLLTLARLNLVRLAPGRTGRQLHRAVSDAEFQRLLTPTLRQFEAVYYGHRTPTAADFATLWATAEAFQIRSTAQVAG